MKYRVEVEELWIQAYSVEADSPEEAKKMVANGEGEPIDNDFEYVNTIGGRDSDDAITEIKN